MANNFILGTIGSIEPKFFQGETFLGTDNLDRKTHPQGHYD